MLTLTVFLSKIISAVVLLVVLAAVGISVGVVVSKNNNKKNVSTSSTSSGSGTNSTPSGSGSTPPSDPRLKKVFWAMAYTPDYALPDFNCAATQSELDSIHCGRPYPC